MRLSHSNVIKVVQKQPKDVDLKTGTLPYCATDDEQILKWNWSTIETKLNKSFYWELFGTEVAFVLLTLQSRVQISVSQSEF